MSLQIAAIPSLLAQAAQGMVRSHPWRCSRTAEILALRVWQWVWWGGLGLELEILEQFFNLSDAVIPPYSPGRTSYQQTLMEEIQ